MKIPYGESSFTTIMEGGYFYQDRTEYIRTLEETVAELDNAEVQLRNYMISNKFMERPSLKAFVVLVQTLHERELVL